MDSLKHGLRSELLLRLLTAGVCAPFFISGITKLVDLGQASQELLTLGIPQPEAVALAVVAVQLGGSGLAILARGGWASLGALSLAGFTVLATWLAHAFWSFGGAARISQMNIFVEHLSIVFALLMIAWLRAPPLQRERHDERHFDPA